MELNQLGAQFIRIRVNDDDITEAFAGVMGDTNTRSFSIELMAENGEILADPDTHLKLLIRQGDGKELLFSDGTYDNSGKYKVQIPNEVFTKEQEITCQFLLEKNGDRLYSHTFKRKVAEGLFGTVREGKTTTIDLEKIMHFGNRYEELMKELNSNADTKLKEYNANDAAKTEAFNNNAESKTLEYNQNATDKTLKFNDNYSEKTKEFNRNSSNKVDEYNKNHEEKLKKYNANDATKTEAYNNNNEEKTEAYNNNHAEKLKILESVKNSINGATSHVDSVKNNIDSIKSDFDSKKNDFDSKYNGVVNIINAENERVEAEKARKDFDERLKRIFTEGLNSEFGEYVKKTDFESETNKLNKKDTEILNLLSAYKKSMDGETNKLNKKDTEILDLLSAYKKSMDGYFGDLGTEVNRHKEENDKLEALLE